MKSRDRLSQKGKGFFFRSRFVLSIKTKQVDGKLVLDKLEARLVFGGHKSVHGVDHHQVAAFTSSSKTVRLLYALAAASNHDVVAWDISNAFVQVFY